MEALLKKAIKERRGKNLGRHVFVDALLQGNLSDKQVHKQLSEYSL